LIQFIISTKQKCGDAEVAVVNNS